MIILKMRVIDERGVGQETMMRFRITAAEEKGRSLELVVVVKVTIE